MQRRTVAQPNWLAAASTVAIGIMSISAPAFAQDAATDDAGIGDIVVTAQKREQNLQDVPIAISAVSNKYLEARDISSIDKLASFAPNVKIERAPTNTTISQISIRGSVTINPAITFEPAVGLYMNGIYIGKAQGSIFDVADLERVEVLRGPQGTLYGRNTLAGAINLITEKPTGRAGGSVELTYGNYDYKRLKATVDLPAFGIFSAKVSGSVTKRDGLIDLVPNPYPQAVLAQNSSRDEANNTNSQSLMVQLRAEPTDAITVDYMFDYSRTRQKGIYSQLVHVNRTGQAADIFDPAAPGNVTAFFPLYLYANPDRQTTASLNEDMFERSKVWGHALTVDFDLGPANLKSITAYRETKFADRIDLDGSPLPIATTARFTDYNAFSQELQLTGKAGSLDYVLGAYFFDDHAATDNPQNFFGTPYESRYSSDTRAWAVYGQADYHLSDQLTLTGGLRYTHEKKDIGRFYQIGAAAPTLDVARGSLPDAKYSTVTPSAVINYKPVENVTVYARYAKGFKSGGFNGETSSLAELMDPYNSEKVDSYEVGLKSRFLDNALQLNISGFWNESKDIQLSVFTAQGAAESRVLNAAKARIRGIEIEAVARPSENLLVQASFGYLQPKYKSFLDGGVDVSDNRAFPHVPKYSVSTSVDWTAWRADSSDMKLNLITDLNFVSAYYTFPYALRQPAANDQIAGNTRADDRTLVDVRAVLSDIPLGGVKAKASLWARNLFNFDKPSNFIDFGSVFGGMIVANYPDPRTYGVTLGVNF